MGWGSPTAQTLFLHKGNKLEPEALAGNTSLMQTALGSVALGRVTGPGRDRNNPRQGLTAKSRSLKMRGKAHIFNSYPLKRTARG